MNNIKIEGANCTLGETQPEYAPLFARKDITKSVHATTEKEYDAESYTVAFELTPEELVSVLNGGKVMVRQLGGWRPTAIWVE